MVFKVWDQIQHNSTPIHQLWYGQFNNLLFPFILSPEMSLDHCTVAMHFTTALKQSLWNPQARLGHIFDYWGTFRTKMYASCCILECIANHASLTVHKKQQARLCFCSETKNLTFKLPWFWIVKKYYTYLLVYNEKKKHFFLN